MRTITSILEDLNKNLEEMKGLDASNTEAMDRCLASDKALKVELSAAQAAEETERIALQRTVKKEAEKGHQFSIVRFIEGAMSGNMTGFEAEMAAAGAEEYRRIGLSQRGKVIPSVLLSRDVHGQNVTTDADGGYLAITTQRYIEDVKEKLVVAAMGASYLTDLVGNVSLPSVGNVQATFLAEGASAPTRVASVANVILTPRGIRANMVTTRDLMKQTSLDVERILMDRLSDAEAACIDKEALKAISTAASSAGSSLTWANAVAMETAINSANANRGSLGYVLSAAAWGTAKTTLKAANVSGYILDGNQINGYKADYSNLLASGVIGVFGNFQDLYIGRWGGIDLLVDPFTLGDTGEIKIQLYSYADAKVAFAKSFSKLASGSGSGSGAGA